MNKNTEKHIDHTRAILDIGKALNKVDLLEAELKTLKGEIVSNPDLKKYLADPSMTRLDKIKTADIAGDIEEVNNVFMESVDYLKKQEYVEVVSAIELDEGTLKKIKEDVGRASGLDVRIRATIDESIIGGLIIKIGEKVIDLSVKNKIEDIKAKLKSVELGGEGFGTED